MWCSGVLTVGIDTTGKQGMSSTMNIVIIYTGPRKDKYKDMSMDKPRKINKKK